MKKSVLFLMCLFSCGLTVSAQEVTASDRHPVDDYLRFAPTAITAGLHFSGYQGRSETPRFLTDNLMSYGIMTLFAKGLKQTVSERRPDGSDDNSFPSGHTAIAFTAATILHKEYGQTRSPWWSVLGYSTATATGVLRALHNRHWAGDVVVGAGIGIISTELGYLIGDLVFKKKTARPSSSGLVTDLSEHPSFFRTNLGMQYISDLKTSVPLRSHVGTSVGVEAAYFLNRYVGLGARARITAVPMTADVPVGSGNITKTSRSSSVTEAWTLVDASAGVYLSCPVASCHRVGVKALYGRRYYGSLDIASMSKTYSDLLSAGVHYTYSLSSGMALSAFADYDTSHPSSFRQDINTLTLGAAMTVPF